MKTKTVMKKGKTSEIPMESTEEPEVLMERAEEPEILMENAEEPEMPIKKTKMPKKNTEVPEMLVENGKKEEMPKNNVEPEMSLKFVKKLMKKGVNYKKNTNNTESEFMERLGLSQDKFQRKQNVTRSAFLKEATVVKSTEKNVDNIFLLMTGAIHEISKVESNFTLPNDIFKPIESSIYPSKNRFHYSDEICSCRKNDKCGAACINRNMFYECSASSCPCGDECENNKIQKQLFPSIEMFESTDKTVGYGMRSLNSILKGKYVIEYIGEIISKKVFEARLQNDYNESQHHYGMKLEKNWIIDAYRMGNNSRFINHSCEPNCVVQKWIVNGLPRMVIVANRNIEPGEELTIDYKFESKQRQECLCKSSNCRGSI